jgi:PAS domain S-box-containing protein
MHQSNIHTDFATIAQIIEGFGESMIILDNETGKIILCNEQAVVVFGYTRQQLEGMDISLLEVKAGDTNRQLKLSEHDSTSAKFVCDYRLASGSSYSFTVTSKTLQVNAKAYLMLSLQEHSLLSRIPKGKVGNLHIFEKFFEKNSLPTLLLDCKGFTIIDINLYAQLFFGLPASQLIGTPLADFSDLSEEEFSSALSIFIDNEYTGLEQTFNTQTIGKRDVEMHYTLIESGSKKRLLCLLVDVTERNQTLARLREFKNSLSEEVKRQTSDLVRINNSLLEQIANRRAAEEELRKSQEMFQVVFQLNPSGMLLRDIETKQIVEVNKRFLKTFGFCLADVQGKLIENLNIISDLDHYSQMQDQLLNAKSVRRIPMDMVSNHGHAVFVEYSSEIITLEKGTFALEVYQDVTQTAIIQQKLAIREEQYRTMFNNALVGIIRSEASNGLVISCNHQYANMLGYEFVSEIVGKSIFKHFAHESQRRDFIRNLNKRGSIVTEFELKTHDKRKLWVVNYATINPLERYIDEVVVDITDRKLMEDLLTSSENRFRSMIENASDLIIIVSIEGKFLYLSPSVRTELGYPIDSLGGTLFDFISPNHIPLITQLLNGEISYTNSYEIDVKHSEGYYKTFEFKATNLLNNSALGGIVINARDITLQIKARNELNLTLQKEQELSRQKTLFISTVSHEFRTPLTNMSLNIQLLKKFVRENRLDKADLSLDRMVNAEKRLIALLNEISLISKDQSGRLQYTPNYWNLHLLLDDLIEQIAYLIQPNVKIDVTKGENMGVLMDRNLLLHILGNLLNNAIKYTPKDKEINVCISVTNEAKLVIEVTDKGIGIPEGEVEFLFEPYFRASNSKQATGSGLGLTIVKRCVELHNGDLNISSKLGEGTQVVCQIPIVKSK